MPAPTSMTITDKRQLCHNCQFFLAERAISGNSIKCAQSGQCAKDKKTYSANLRCSKWVKWDKLK